MDLSPRQLFLQSLDRCSANEQFIPAFYERFLATSFEVRFKFRNTNFQEQNQMLLRSLRLAAGAASGDPDSLREIRERAESHDRHHLNIKPKLYDAWLTSVISVAGEYDEQWDEPTEEAWNTILGHVINQMVKFY